MRMLWLPGTGRSERITRRRHVRTRDIRDIRDGDGDRERHRWSWIRFSAKPGAINPTTVAIGDFNGGENQKLFPPMLTKI
jgi:hypothetical protein